MIKRRDFESNSVELGAETPKEVFLEIGTGMVAMRGSEGTDKLKIGIDWTLEYIGAAKRINERGHQERMSFMAANAEKMPFKDKSVETIVMKDVIGEPPSRRGEKRYLLNEVRRVIKDDGTLVLLEVVTPNVRLYFGDRNGEYARDVEEDVMKSGFESRKIVPSDPEWPELMNRYIGERAYGQVSFILVAKPKVESLPGENLDKLI